MAGFVYFVPAARALGPAQQILDAAGADYVCLGDPTRCVTESGPDERSGIYIVPEVGTRGEQLNVQALPADLVWLPGEGNAFLFAYSPGKPPTTADLARPEQLAGHVVQLADGSEWLVPVARYVSGEVGFPQTLARSNGKWVMGQVMPAYAALWEGACRAWDSLFGPEQNDEPPTLKVADGADVAALALNANYRVSAEELGALGVLDTMAMQRVLKALVDFPGFMALQKKTEVARAP